MPGTTIPARFQADTIGGMARVTYDFADYGGAIGWLELPLEMPEGAVITSGVLDVVSQPTSEGLATISLGMNAANDLLPATAIANVTGRIELPDPAIIKVNENRRVTMTIAVAELTGGVGNIYLTYYSPIAEQ